MLSLVLLLFSYLLTTFISSPNLCYLSISIMSIRRSLQVFDKNSADKSIQMTNVAIFGNIIIIIILHYLLVSEQEQELNEDAVWSREKFRKYVISHMGHLDVNMIEENLKSAM